MEKILNLLLSEIFEIENILKNIPEENIIDRLSFEQRLEEVKKLLKQLR